MREGAAPKPQPPPNVRAPGGGRLPGRGRRFPRGAQCGARHGAPARTPSRETSLDRKSTRLNSSHDQISYAVFCLKKKKKNEIRREFYRVAIDVQYVEISVC